MTAKAGSHYSGPDAVRMAVRTASVTAP